MSYYLEFLALIWFFVCWGGYTWYSRNRANSRSCLSNTLDLYREDWMRVMLKRENRISDASVVGNLERNGAFFASSCLLILAGIITALGYTSEAMEIFATMPFSAVPSREIWELRLVVLLVVFIYAFFKFTWSMRMYNFVAVMIGSAPLPDDSKTAPATSVTWPATRLTLACVLTTMPWLWWPGSFIRWPLWLPQPWWCTYSTAGNSTQTHYPPCATARSSKKPYPPVPMRT